MRTAAAKASRAGTAPSRPGGGAHERPAFRPISTRSDSTQGGFNANRLRERDARASTRGFPLRLAHWMKGFAIVLSLSATHAFAQQSPARPTASTTCSSAPIRGRQRRHLCLPLRYENRQRRTRVVGEDRESVVSVAEPRRSHRLRGQRTARRRRAGDHARRHQRVPLRREDGRAEFHRPRVVGRNDPCYLALSPDGKYLVTANYSVAKDPGGSFAVFPLRDDGAVGSRADRAP